jgi:uncharacterized protein (TIRG00374 family)
MIVRASRFRRLAIVGSLISLGLLVLLVSQVQIAKSWDTLAQLSGRSLLLPVLVTVVGLSLRPWRWQVLFPAKARPGFWHCFGVFAIANMANNVLPSRGGDIIRCVLVGGERSLSSAGLALGTLGVEKMLDGIALLATVLIACLLMKPPEWLLLLALMSSLVLVGTIALVILIQRRCLWCLEWTRRLFKRFHIELVGEKISVILDNFGQGLTALNSVRNAGALVLSTAVIWLVEAALICTLASALEISLSFPAGMVVSGILGLGLMIPAAPGYIGTYEFFSVAALSLFGVEKENAFAFTLLLHGWVFLTVTGLGLVSLTISGIHISDLAGLRSQH